MQQQTIETLRQALQESALPFAQQEPLASHTTFQIGGPAVFWCTPKNANQLRRTLALCRANGVRLLATALRADAHDLREETLSQTAVIIGSEGQGVCREMLDAADGTVIIPMQSYCESLNAAVAATIVMWQMRR